jgi:hypothetical protein
MVIKVISYLSSYSLNFLLLNLSDTKHANMFMLVTFTQPKQGRQSASFGGRRMIMWGLERGRRMGQVHHNCAKRGRQLSSRWMARQEHGGRPIFSQCVLGQVIGHLDKGWLAKPMGWAIKEHAGRGSWTVPTRTVRATARYPPVLVIRVSSATSFVSKQQKLEPKLVSALSETRRLFRLFRFNIETGSFSVLKQPKQTKDKPKQQQTC